jgi:hypothetical protein
LTNLDNPNIMDLNLPKRAAGGRHHIGIPSGFKSEQAAGFLLECIAGFVGMRIMGGKHELQKISCDLDVGCGCFGAVRHGCLC